MIQPNDIARVEEKRNRSLVHNTLKYKDQQDFVEVWSEEKEEKIRELVRKGKVAKKAKDELDLAIYEAHLYGLSGRKIASASGVNRETVRNTINRNKRGSNG